MRSNCGSTRVLKRAGRSADSSPPCVGGLCACAVLGAGNPSVVVKTRVHSTLCGVVAAHIVLGIEPTEMRELSTDNLTDILANSMETLGLLPDLVESDPLIQSVLKELVESGDRIVPRFLHLLNDHPGTAEQILKSSVSGLASLHAVHTAKTELKRRAEAN